MSTLYIYERVEMQKKRDKVTDLSDKIQSKGFMSDGMVIRFGNLLKQIRANKIKKLQGNNRAIEG